MRLSAAFPDSFVRHTIYIQICHLNLMFRGILHNPTLLNMAKDKRGILLDMWIFSKVSNNLSIKLDLLPPKLQRMGLVFKGKMGYNGACMMGYYNCALRVTMERVWWVTMKPT